MRHGRKARVVIAEDQPPFPRTRPPGPPIAHTTAPRPPSAVTGTEPGSRPSPGGNPGSVPVSRRRAGIHDYPWHYATYLTHRPPLTEAEKAKTPPVRHPVIRTHPVTGRRALYVSEGLTRTIDGMDDTAGRDLIVEVSRFATEPRFVYAHKWKPGDLVFWDNRCTMHRATEFDDRYRRLMRRTTIEGDEPA